MTRRLLAVGLLALGGAFASADDRAYDRSWPQWRGPTGNGVALHAEPPVTWSEERGIIWKVEIPGRGMSTPIVWGDRIFLTTAIQTDRAVDPKKVEEAESKVPDWRRESGIAPAWVQQYALVAVDRTSGQVLWTKVLRESAPHEGLHSDSSWASASPVTDGEILIAHFGSNGTYALDLEGKLLWKTDLGDMTTRRGFGEGSSPAIHGNRVVINWDHEGNSFIVALNRKNGKLVWKMARDEVTSWSTPIVVERRGKAQVVINATNRTRGYDLESGEVLWEVGGMTVNTIPSPLHEDGRVFVTSGYRGNLMLAIDLRKAKGDLSDSPAVLWEYAQDTPYVPSPLLYEGRIYFVKHNKAILTALDADSGEPAFARQRLEGINGVYASLVGAAGRVYIVGRGGNTMVIRHAPEFEVLAVNTLDDDFDASPAIVGDRIYLRGHRYLYALGASPDAAHEPGLDSGMRNTAASSSGLTSIEAASNTW